MKKSLVLLFALGLIAAGCQKSSSDSSSSDSKPAPLDPSKSQVSDNPAMAPVDYMGTVAKGRKQAEAKTAINQFNKAIQMYEALEGRKPESLEQLVKEGHLAKMPKTPYGMKFTYDPKTGKVAAVMAK